MDRKSASRLPTTLLLVISALWSVTAQEFALPTTPNSVKFAAIGDTGSGDSEQYDVANQMARFRAKFPFDFAIMLGDNIYGGQGATDLVKKFSQPYKALLDGGVIDQKELSWLENALKTSTEDWKICYFHHPLYSDGGTHGSAVDIRVVFEPLFVTYGVNVVFAGHDHIYERITPQKGIYHFVEGASGQLRKGDAKRSPMNAKSFDTDMSFMLVEIDGDRLSFQAISRTGATIDSGTIQRQARPAR
jgi:hypothetical protein